MEVLKVPKASQHWVLRRNTQLPIHRLGPCTLFRSTRHYFGVFKLICLSNVKFDYGASFKPQSFGTVSSTLLAAEKEEAKAVLSLFLGKQGLSNALAARTINRSEKFIDHLISKLHSLHKSSYLVGRELTTLQIREAIVPYLESLLKEHGVVFVDMVQKFPDPPDKPKPNCNTYADASSTGLLDCKKQRAIARVSEQGSEGLLPPNVLYLIEIGMDHHKIKETTRKFPAFAYYNLERKIKPVVEFLLELGVPRKDIPIILYKRPQLCGISLSENIVPTMAFLEDLGVDKTKWAKVIYRFPALLTYSRKKVQTSVDFFTEIGVSAKNIGKILTRCPHIISYSVDDKLRPTAEYFDSLGVDSAALIHRCPQTFGLSVEDNLKPITRFFLDKGYTSKEVQTMVIRYGALYTFSLAGNLIPKWDFFQTMDYPNSELVKFPQFFGYSLEERIKPRYGLLKESGVEMILNQMLTTSNAKFEAILKKKMEKIVV